MEQKSEVSAASSRPVFKTRTDQLVYVASKLACLCVDIMKEVDPCCSLPEREIVEDLITRKLPPEFVVSYICEANEKFGNELECEDLSAVAKIVALASTSSNVGDITKQMLTFVGKLEETPVLKKKFFCYVKLLRKIISAK